MTSFFQISARQFITYCLIGFFNTAIHFFAFLFFLKIFNYQTISNFLGFCLGLCFSFFMNAYFTFKEKPDLKKFVRMALTSGGLAFSFGFLGDFFKFNPFVTFGLYVVVNPIIGFILTKYYVFSSAN